jgi:hypothetical protein
METLRVLCAVRAEVLCCILHRLSEQIRREFPQSLQADSMIVPHIR